MSESISAITSIIKDVIEIGGKIKGHFDAKKKRRLAQTLHLVYIRLNDSIATGEQIIDVLERFVLDPGQLCYSGKYEVSVDGIFLKGLVNRQVQNIKALYDSLGDYSEIIRALDAELYVLLEQFVAFKGVGLNWLAVHLSRGMIPFDTLDLDDVKHLAHFSSYMLDTEKEADKDIDPIKGAIENFLPWYNEVAIISRRLEDSSFEIDTLFNHEEQDFDKAVKVDQLNRLSDFLRRNDLRHHLDEAKKNMRVIKEFIETNFSTVDLMLDVGSEQLKKKPGW